MASTRITGLLVLALLQGIQAQSITQSKITAEDGAADDQFGFAVSIAGDYALVGAPQADQYQGAAYIFHSTESGWLQVQKLTQPDVAPASFFGFAVALDEHRAIVTARNDDDNGVNAGSAYVYERREESWVHTAKLLAADGRDIDFFGNAVALSGDRVLVGAPGSTVSRGAAYIYIFDAGSNTWRQEARLAASDGQPDDLFGVSVALDDSLALIGAHGRDDRGDESGAAYVFRRNGSQWQQEARLIPADAVAEDLFGTAVAIEGDHALIGAIGDDSRDFGAGAVYAYRFDRRQRIWVEAQQLLASEGQVNDQFGNAVAISGEFALVGAIMQFNSGTGAVYLFRRNGDQWDQAALIGAFDAGVNDRFGNAVDINGSVAIVGARNDDDRRQNAGAAYILTGFATTVGIEKAESTRPQGLALLSNYPNPFNSETVIQIDLPKAAATTLRIHDAGGRVFCTLIDRRLPAGRHQIRWDGSMDGGTRAGSGVYFAVLHSGRQRLVRKLLLLR